MDDTFMRESKLYQKVGCPNKDGEDNMVIGPCYWPSGDPAGFMAMQGNLIHLDVDSPFDYYIDVEDAIDAAIVFLHQNKHFTGRIYKTYNGIRILMTHDFKPPNKSYFELDGFQGIDKKYISGIFGLGVFITRITPKPNRAERVVAEKVYETTNGEIHPLAWKYADMHDKLVGEL